MKAEFDPVTLATPFFILSIILEIVLARMGKADARYETKDTAVSLGMGLMSSVAGLLTAGVVFACTLWAYEHRLFTIPMTAIWASFKNGKLCVDLADISAPRATLSLPGWPPKNLTKDLAA